MFTVKPGLHGIIHNKVCRLVAPTPSRPIRAHVHHVSDSHAKSLYSTSVTVVTEPFCELPTTRLELESVTESNLPVWYEEPANAAEHNPTQSTRFTAPYYIPRKSVLTRQAEKRHLKSG